MNNDAVFVYHRHVLRAKKKANRAVRFFILMTRQNRRSASRIGGVCSSQKYKGGYMKFTHRFLTLIFAIVLLTGISAISVSAQRRGGGRIIRRPVIVRNYYVPNPYWYRNYWGYGYYDPYFYDPYLQARQQKYYLERELSGNRAELRKHLEKYNADGVITAKERAELADDYRDIEKAQRRLNDFNRRY
jgi:hypothetical protein